MKDLENYKNKIKFNGEQLEKCKGIIEQLEKQIQNCALKERDNENLKNENSLKLNELKEQVKLEVEKRVQMENEISKYR